MKQPEQENKFENCNVYKIVCNVTGKIYVGSTTIELKKRLSQHKNHYKSYLNGKSKYVTSFKVIENNDCDIHLLGNYDLKDNSELLIKERYWFEKLNNVNKNTPGRTLAETKEYHDRYRIENRAIINTNQNALCICACGCTYSKSHKSHHEKTKKHIKLMAAIVPQIV